MVSDDRFDLECNTVRSIFPDYAFVRKGNVYIARKAKEHTKAAGKMIYRMVCHAWDPDSQGNAGGALHSLRLRDEGGKKEAMRCLEGMFGKFPQEDCEEVVKCAIEKVAILSFFFLNFFPFDSPSSLSPCLIFSKQTLTRSSIRVGSGVYAYPRGSGWPRSRVSTIGHTDGGEMLQRHFPAGESRCVEETGQKVQCRPRSKNPGNAGSPRFSRHGDRWPLPGGCHS